MRRRPDSKFGVIFYLTDRPVHATWLESDEKTWLETRLEAESNKKKSAEHLSIGKAL